MRLFVRVVFALVAAWIAGAAPLAAQQVSVAGIVRDTTSDRPLVGAIVALGDGTRSRSTRSDGDGRFSFSNVPPGSYTLSIRQLGFQPVRQTIEVGAANRAVTVYLSRIARLDTVRVRAAEQAIYGVVGATNGLRPLPHATLQIFGSSLGQATTDSTGRFFYPVKTPGPYLVRAKIDGYTSQTVSVVVPPHEGTEVALLLDSAVNGASHRLEAGFVDMRSRLLVRRLNSALVPRGDLLATEAEDLSTAIRLSRSFTQRAVRLGPTACVFIDGTARPGLDLSAIDPREVEAIEVYGEKGDASSTLARQWPRSAPCGNTGVTSAVAPGPDVVRWIAIWTKP